MAAISNDLSTAGSLRVLCLMAFEATIPDARKV
jgi:hypothetical protein